MVRLFIILNVAVFVAWKYFAMQGDATVMNENFLVSWDSLVEKRYWTLVGSVFSHNMLFHILLNMMVLASFGPLLEKILSARRFLFFYMTAGVFASLSHAVVSKFLMDSPDLPALGASGAVAGVVLLFSLMFPREKILLFGIVPVPALFGALGFIGLDIWGLVAQTKGGGLPIGHGAHLGGALIGILYYFGVVRRRWRHGT